MSALLAQVDLGQKTILNNFTPNNMPGIGGVGTNTPIAAKYSQLSSFLNLFVPLSFIIAGVILLFLLIGGGFSIIASGGNAKNVESGKQAVTGAIVGFFVIFCAYWIVLIIGKVTGVPIFDSTL